MKLLKISQGIVLEVYVKPNSKEFKMKTENDELTIYCRETPEKGRANRELVRELSRVFHKRVEILSGLTSKQKRVLVRETSEEEVNQFITLTRNKYC